MLGIYCLPSCDWFSSWVYTASSPLQEEISALLQRKLINVNSQDSNHRTAIAVAAGEGRADVVRFLISQGSEVNQADLTGNTPLFYALQGKHEDVIRCRYHHSTDCPELS